MGLYDRDYTQDGFQQQHGRMPRMRFAVTRLTPAVKWLLIINAAVFLLTAFASRSNSTLVESFVVVPTPWIKVIQIWRYITYQFLHVGFGHIFLNMLGLFFLGPTLERNWGSKKFLIFYLGCGAIAGLFYPILVWIGILNSTIGLVGASGAILAMLAACAILFPQFVVFIIVFPVPIRIAAIGLIVFYIANLFVQGQNAGGDAAHLGGMIAGAAYVFWPALRSKIRLKAGSRRWQSKMSQQNLLQAEVDRILQKVHNSGIQSLTWKERKILKKATRAHQGRG